MTKQPTATLGVLIKARKLIEIGWAKGTNHRVRNGVDCYCAMGAIDVASDQGALWQSAICRFMDEVPNGQGVVGFNDSSPNKKRVLAAFDRAIKKERKMQRLLG